MIKVTSKVFFNYIKENNLTPLQAIVFHGTNYIDLNGNILAYCEYSSWNNIAIYMIETKFINDETTIFVTNQINKLC